MRHISFAIVLASCAPGEITGGGPFEDTGSAIVVLEGDELDRELAASPAREAPEPFVRLGLLWDADSAGAIEIATSADGATWSEFATPVVNLIEVEETGSFVGQLEVQGEPARWYRIRGVQGAAATFVRLELITFTLADGTELGDEDDGMTPRSRTVGTVEVHTRSEWSARAPRCSSSLGTPYRMAIHHTETPTNDTMSPQARLRQIQSYHMDVKGWCDIGYHYLVSRDGRIWEGRPDTRLGSHAGGANTGNIGISVMGSHGSTPITAGQLDQIAALVRGLADAKGIPIERSRIKGHREYTSTSCPGAALFGQLGEIVARARDGGAPEPPPPAPGDCSLDSDGPWSCGGLTGTTTNAAGIYYTTSFGCWIDEAGVAHSDGGDNCIPACSLASIGCSGMSGPACERSINWYAADSDRFGCGTRIKVTNPDTGDSAVLMVIDRGPSCTIEHQVDHWVLDMSYRASYYLFGEPTSATERADVRVEVVDPSTPLGPYDGSATCTGGGSTPPPAPPPSGTASLQGVVYHGPSSLNRIPNASISLSTGHTATADGNGYYLIHNLPGGPVTITASAPGYTTGSVSRDLVSGTTTWGSVQLAP